MIIGTISTRDYVPNVPKDQRDQNDYTPNPKFKRFLEDRLHIEKNRLAGISQNMRGRELTLKERERRRIRINRNKNYWLNKGVFQSMANLIYFLEYVQEHEELQPVFEKDLKELFLARYVNQKKVKKNDYNDDTDISIGVDKKPSFNSDIPVFQRFISLATTTNWRKKDNDTDFRLALINILAVVLYHKLNHILPYLRNRGLSSTDPIMMNLRNVIFEIETLTKKVVINIEEPNRPVGF